MARSSASSFFNRFISTCKVLAYFLHLAALSKKYLSSLSTSLIAFGSLLSSSLISDNLISASASYDSAFASCFFNSWTFFLLLWASVSIYFLFFFTDESFAFSLFNLAFVASAWDSIPWQFSNFWLSSYIFLANFALTSSNFLRSFVLIFSYPAMVFNITFLRVCNSNCFTSAASSDTVS